MINSALRHGLGLAISLTTSLGFAGLSSANTSADRAMFASRCLDAAREAEAEFRLPNGLLVAMAVVESALHPYAIGGRSEAYYAQDRAQAMRLVRAMGPNTSGGCLQVNIGVHAPTNPSWVFDPVSSARFAAAHLREVADDGTSSTGEKSSSRGEDWAAALARYNGGAPNSAAGRAYACRVRAAAEVMDGSTAALIRPGRCITDRAVKQKAETLIALALTTTVASRR